MKNQQVKKAIAALSCCSVLSFSAFGQVHEDIWVRWGEEDSTSYVEIVNGKFGIVMEGKRTLETKYQIENFEEAIRYDGNAYFYDGAAFVLGLDGKWGVMDNRGKLILPFEYDYVRIERDFDNDKMEFAGVEKNGKVALADRNGKLLTGFDFDAFYGYYLPYGMRLSSPKLALKQGAKVVFYDPESKKILSEAPEQEFGVEAKTVYYKNKMGAISRTGEIILPVEYDAVYSTDGTSYSYKSQTLAVGNNGKYGIWQYGKGMILPMQYASATAGYVNSKMYFVVTENGKHALLNKEGQNITGFEYDSMYIYNEMIVGTKGDIQYKIETSGATSVLEK
jgi:hypothetical protein